MKKTTKIMFAALSAFMLVGCGVNQGMADKINDAYKDSKEGNEYTAEKLEKQLGKPTYDLTVTLMGSRNGSMIWVAGCKDAEDAKAKNEAGKELKALTVVILNGVATAASFDVWNGQTK